MVEKKEPKYTVLCDVNNGKRQVKVTRKDDEYNGNAYSMVNIEWYGLNKDGKPFTKAIKDESGNTHYVNDVKRASIPLDVAETLIKELKL